MVSIETLRPEAAVTLECRLLVKRFGGVRAVDHLSADFRAGTITALVGPNGAGKTTLFHLLSGALVPDEGEVWYRGRCIDGLQHWQVARRGIGRLFQDVRVFPRLTAFDNVLVAFPDQVGENVAWSVLRRRALRRQEDAWAERARELLELVELAPLANRRAEQLSYGEQKLLAIARLLAAAADVLLLDEPTAGIHPRLGRQLLALLRQLAAGGKTVVVIEHDMRVVLEVASRVYFMERGEITARGPAEAVLQHPRVRAHYLGM